MSPDFTFSEPIPEPALIVSKRQPLNDDIRSDLRGCAALDAKFWLAVDSRGEAEPERGGDSPARFSNPPGQTAEGNRSNTFSPTA